MPCKLQIPNVCSVLSSAGLRAGGQAILLLIKPVWSGVLLILNTFYIFFYLCLLKIP